MAFAIFKQSMLAYMQNQNGIKDSKDFAKKITQEYDMCIKRGLQIANNVPIQKGNTSLMEQLVNIACMTALSKQKGLHTFGDDIGKAVLGYWTGATLQLMPPLIPAGPVPQAIVNISSTVALCTSPGTWTPMGPNPPTDDSGMFLDMLIAGMLTHSLTPQFMYTTVSLYPGPTGPTPGPGVVLGTGFTIPAAGPSAPATPDGLTSSFLGRVISVLVDVVSNLVMSPAQVELAKLEKAEADAVANDTSLPASGRGSAREYSKLKSSEISSGKINAAAVELSDEELEAIEENTPDKYKCEVGTRIVAIAKRDIGILEYGTPPGLNYGGFPGGAQLNKRGRIDDMFDNVGLDNQEKVRRKGSGYYWCAAAVATWWQEAGLETPSGGASCDNWMSWGKQKGYWSSTPKIGAAVLYGKPSDAHHIGIVAAVTPTGGVITIEGNTGGGGFSRNGCGVFQKVPKRYLGFVIPPSCV